jgi:PAS domain S-box-containing protein
MEEKLRKSGIDIVGDVPWGTHFCQLYQTKEDLMDILLPYFRAGLENNECCIWVTSEPLDSEEVKEALRRTSQDFDTYLDNGQIEIIPHTHRYLKNGTLDFKRVLSSWVKKANETLSKGYDGLRLSGNSFWLDTHWEDFICYEEQVDSVIGEYRMLALCTYSLDKCNATGIADLVSNHQFILAKKEGKWQKIENSGRRRAEEAEVKLKDTLENLENKIKERTAELEKAYNSLMENERRLSEAQEMAHIGNWDWNLKTGEIYWSDELYRIFGINPQKFGLSFDKVINYVHPDDREYLINAIKAANIGKTFDIDYRIISDDREERVVHAQSEIIFDEEKNPVRIRGTIQDITERKMAEEAMEKMDEIRIKEIHHRIKNNLQVISSLLSLQAEKFSDSKILEAFRESQNRVASMALIHEELYKGDKIKTLDFADYLRKLTADLLSSYRVGNDNTNLRLDLEQVFLG